MLAKHHTTIRLIIEELGPIDVVLSILALMFLFDVILDNGGRRCEKALKHFERIRTTVLTLVWLTLAVYVSSYGGVASLYWMLALFTPFTRFFLKKGERWTRRCLAPGVSLRLTPTAVWLPPHHHRSARDTPQLPPQGARRALTPKDVARPCHMR